MLCPSGDRIEIRENEHDGLVAPLDRLGKGTAAIKAATTALRNKNKFTVLDEIKETAAEAAKCRDPVRRKLLRKSARKARREFEASRTDLPGSKMIQKATAQSTCQRG